jgi:adenylate cyclase class 2
VIEREIKLRFDSVEAARAAVARLDARPLTPRRLQDDRLLDRDDAALRTRGCALRIRRDGDDVCVTFKGPVVPGAMKTREELETSVGDAEILTRLFEELGYVPRWRYQKYREEYGLDGLIIAIDDTPIGVFVELEGDETAITSAAAKIGRGPEDYVVTSYRTLFVQHCESRGLPPIGNMVFEP